MARKALILITVFALPVYTIAGPSLMGTFVTSLASVFFYQIIAPYYPELSVAPNWLLGFLYGIGGFIGIYLGARAQKYMPAKFINFWVDYLSNIRLIQGMYVIRARAISRMAIKGSEAT